MTDFAAPPPALNEVEKEGSTVEPVVKITTRSTYKSEDALSPSSVLPSPIEQFKLWFKTAQEDSRVFEPETMTLGTTLLTLTDPSNPTSTPIAIPSSRVVLLKSVDARGFVLFTNYTSRKSRELLANPYASLAFYWREMHRQVRVVGKAEMVDRRESDDYYNSRPLGSRIGAWASRQSTVVGEGEVTNRYEKLEERFGAVSVGEKGERISKAPGEVQVPPPEFWGGWRIVPFEVEFWAGKPSRLHDRVRYRKTQSSDTDESAESVWTIERLAP
ncbi:pyridoxamine 5'-phosphate oxidase [Clavulina sp. PMI_390]|nr:pyridoxamine 5'-phosphate oxidase [Clavulina sp. PMI_390]